MVSKIVSGVYMCVTVDDVAHMQQKEERRR